MPPNCTHIILTCIRHDSVALLCTIARYMTCSLMCWDVEKTTVQPTCTSRMKKLDERACRVDGSSRSSTPAMAHASAGLRRAGLQWAQCHPHLVVERRLTLSLAIQAFATLSEPLWPRFVWVLGPHSRARSARGPYLEHVVRTGSVMAAAHRRRQCSTSLSGNPYFLSFTHPRDTFTHLPVNFYGLASPFGSVRTGRTYGPSTPNPRAGKGVKSRCLNSG